MRVSFGFILRNTDRVKEPVKLNFILPSGNSRERYPFYFSTCVLSAEQRQRERERELKPHAIVFFFLPYSEGIKN